MREKTLQERRGCKKEKKDQPTTNNKKGTDFKNTKTKIIKRVRMWDPMKLELSYMYIQTHNNGRRGHR